MIIFSGPINKLDLEGDPMKSILLLALVLIILLESIIPVPVSANTRVEVPQLNTTDLVKRGQATTGLLLMASLSKSTIAPGDPVSLIMQLKNVSNNVRRIGTSNFQAEFDIFVQDENGKFVAPKKPPFKAISTNGWVDIKPGEAYSENYLLSDLYDFVEIGKYHITVARDINNPFLGTPYHNAGFAFSNTVIIAVTDKLVQGLLLSSSIDHPFLAINTPLMIHLALTNTSDSVKTIQFDQKQNPLTLAVQDFTGDLLSG